MEVITDIDAIPRLQNPVVTVGSFDGVHLGHRRVFAQVKEEAKRINGTSVAITFSPHPQLVLHPNSDFFQIFPLEENIRLISETGIDYLIIIPFTREFSQLSPETFIERILIEKIDVKVVVMGPNHSFGHNREGNHDTISELCHAKNIRLVDIPEFVLHDIKVRSAQIRKLIANNNWDIAAELLGR